MPFVVSPGQKFPEFELNFAGPSPLDLDAVRYDYEACMAMVVCAMLHRNESYLDEVVTLQSDIRESTVDLLKSSRFQATQGLLSLMQFLEQPRKFTPINGVEVGEYFRIPIELLPNSECLGFFGSTITPVLTDYGIDFCRYFVNVPQSVLVNTAEIFLFRSGWPERTVHVYGFCLSGIQYLFVRCGGGSYEVYLQAEDYAGNLFEDYLTSHVGYHVVRVNPSTQSGLTKQEVFQCF